MVSAVINVVGTKVKGRILGNRGELCRLLGISSKTLSNRLKSPYLKRAEVDTVGGKMFDLEKVLSIQIRPVEVYN